MRFLNICCFILPAVLFSQNYSIPTKMDTINSVMIRYENDLFARSDKYYTQGFFCGITRWSALKKWSGTRFGIVHQVYTPSSILSEKPLYHDHPYSAQLMGYFFKSKNLIPNRISLTVGTLFGFSGPQAFGKQMQTKIHEFTKSDIPLGWEYQLKSGFVFDAQVVGEINLLRSRRYFGLVGLGKISLGTRNTEVELSGRLNLSVPFKKGTFGIRFQPGVRIVGYDGTLQGILFSAQSQVVLSKTEIERIVAEHELEVYLQIGKCKFGYWRHFQTKRFHVASNQSWGGIGMTVNLRNGGI